MKIKKILMTFIIIIIVYGNTVYGKYRFNFEETIAILKRDNEKPICNLSYSTTEWTNQNVILTITSNKEIQQASGFELSEDKKVLKKEFIENESGKIEIRDLSGNYEEIEYDIASIDKEMPQIIGCEDGGRYLDGVSLEYMDNVDIKDVFVDKYGENLKVESYNQYYDSSFYYGIDKTDTTLTIHVTEHPKETKKYRYYINKELFMTSPNSQYTFTGLQKGTEYEIKIEAIDAFGNVLDTDISYHKTGYYKSIVSSKNSNDFIATFEGLDKSISKIKYAVWNTNDNKSIKWYHSEIKDNKATIQCVPYDSIYYDSYTIHTYMYDENDNILDVIEFSIDFGTNFVKRENSKIDMYHLTESGNYQISVTDLADNKITYCIKVE